MKRLSAIPGILCISTILLVLAALAACGNNAPAPDDSSAEQLELTAAELAQYDGKDGQPAYIAIDGVIYDVTDVPQWKNGEHNGFTAGRDLTEEIKTISPHGVSKLKGLPVVGRLITD
jgi:Predicted heme/steroid binding protein